MLKLLSIFILSTTAFVGPWILYDMENGLSIQFPTKPKIEIIVNDSIVYSANNNCEFSVYHAEFPKQVFPETEIAKSMVLERSVKKSKEAGTFIASQNFVVGKIKGIEVKSHFMPASSVKLIQVERSFFFNYRRYTLRCLYNNKNEAVCEKDCKKFFSSLKVHNK